MSSTPPFKLPTSAPTATARQDLVKWGRLTDEGLTRGRKAAEIWRNGLAGFVTLLLSALVLKGNDLAATPQPYRTLAVAGCLGGVICAITGLWQTLRAEAPSESQVSFQDLIAKHGSISAYEQSLAATSQTRLHHARGLVIVALALLIFGVGAWWLAPTAEPPLTKVDVHWSMDGQDHQVCGTLVPTGAQEIAVQANTATEPVKVPITDVVTVVQVNSCS